MRWWTRLWRKSRADRQLDSELHFHLERQIADYIAAGMPPDQAQRRARLEFGGLEQTKEKVHQAERGHFLETLLQDVRFGVRMLRKDAAFTVLAILTLTLGIGANTAIFSVVDAALLKPLRFERPSKLVLVWENEPSYGLERNVVSPANFFDWQRQNHCFSAMALFLDQPANLTGAGEPEQVGVEEVSPNFFSVLGVNPMFGRGFSLNKVRPSQDHVAVLSYGLWESKFGADPNILGKTLELDGESFTIIGVMRRDFDFYISEFSFTGHRAQAWIPLELPPSFWHDRSKVGRFLRVIARVKPGLALTQAQSQMNMIASGLARRYPDYNKGWGVTLVSLRDEISGALRPALLILLGAVGLVLLIACANISGLLLSRATTRRREFAIRTALGASPARLARQLLTESILLSGIGGLVGASLAIGAIEALFRAGSANLFDLAGVSVSWRVLAFTAAMTLLAGLLAGFLPSFLAARAEVASALPQGGRTSSEGHQGVATRNVLVVAEVSLALVLLAGSGLLIQSLFRLTEVDPGFRAPHLLTFQISLPDKYHQDPASANFFGELLRKIRALPGALSASADASPPFTAGGSRTDFQIVGQPPLPPTEAPDADIRVIEDDYFATMGIPLLRGRTFHPREYAWASNVVVISNTFAQRYFAGKNPLGQKIIIDMKDQNLPDEIVGVVGDVHQTSLKTAPFPIAYWPFAEDPYYAMTFVVRTTTPPLSMVPAVRQVLHGIDRDQPMAKISTMDRLVNNSIARPRFTTLLLSAFAGLALLLACIGIYSVIAYSVSQRTNEIGIRLALGAQRNDILRLVLIQGVRLALTGAAVGIAAALLLTRLMTALLYGVRPGDPLTFALVSLLLVLLAMLACYVPARRAMRVDPMVALRHE